jgi:hypothetical protein
MAKLAIKKASTDVTTYVFIQDSSKTTGEGLTGLAYNTASLVGYYVRPKGSATAITLATQTVTGDHSDGGFKEIDATNMPGVYRLDLPDAVCATGVPSVVVMLKGATNMSPVVLEIQLTDFDLNTAAITAAAIADAVWDEATADHTTATSFGSLDANVDAILADTGTDGVKIASAQTVATVTNLTNLPTMPTDWLTAAGLKADAVTEIQSGLATAAALDAVDNFVDTEVAAILAAVDTEVAAIKAKTDNLPASPAAVGSAMTLTAAYDKAKDDVLTPLGVVDGIVDAIKVQTDKIPATPASAGEYTTNIGAIKAKTDNLPLSPASSGEYTSALTAIQNDLDNPNQYKADVSNLALQATSLAIKGQTDKIPAAPAQTGEYNAALTAIQADLDNPTQYKADVSGLATQASVNAIPTTPLLAANYIAPNNAGIASILEDTGTTIPATLAGLATSTEVGAIALLGETVIGSYTVQDILKILAAKMVGKATGGSTATITYRGVDDTSNVIVETVDSNGNRSAVTLTV